MTIQLREDVRQERGKLRVDREQGIIFDPKVLGWISANGREYLRSGVRAEVYEGCKIVAGHGGAGERSPLDVYGFLEGAYVNDQGVYARRLRFLNPSGPFECRCMGAAQNAPWLLGLSHEAQGRERPGSYGKIIESVESVSAVAIVCDAATVSGFFESRGRGRGARSAGADVPATVAGRARWLSGGPDFESRRRVRDRLERIAERLSRNGNRRGRLLLEMAEAGLLGDDVLPGDATSGVRGQEVGPEQKQRRGLVKKLAAILQDQTLTLDAALDAVAELLDADPTTWPADAEADDKEESRRLFGRGGALTEGRTAIPATPRLRALWLQS